jgi:3-deoxy-D-manno-octulosonic-acid transferase
VNARLSQRSAGRWKKLPKTIGTLLRNIDITLAQTQEDGVRFQELGAPLVAIAGNLKYDVPALPCDPLELAELKSRIGSRPVWVAASTHEGEEEIALDAHERLKARWPGIVTIIVPRHPERGIQVGVLAALRGIPVKLRSRKEEIGKDGCIYIADTIGELGLFYRVAGIVFVGRSLVRHGGQNPIEPAKLGNAILHGPNVSNFTDVYRELNQAAGAREVADAQELGDTLEELFADSARMRSMARAASDTVDRLGGATQNIMNAIEPYLLQAQLEQH